MMINTNEEIAKEIIEKLENFHGNITEKTKMEVMFYLIKWCVLTLTTNVIVNLKLFPEESDKSPQEFSDHLKDKILEWIDTAIEVEQKIQNDKPK